MLLVGSEGLTRRTISEIPDCRRQTARRLRRVGEIEGVEITNSDGRWIVARLRDVGRADDATAAVSIEHGLDFGYAIDWLTPAEKDAVMMVLAMSPPSLRRLRDSLARDHFDRQ